MLIMSSVTVHVLLSNCKSRYSFINWNCGKLSRIFPVRPLIQKPFCASDEGYKMASCVASETWYLYSVQNLKVIRWPLFIFKHLWKVLVEAFLRDTCNTRRVSCILLNLICCSVWQQSVALFNEYSMNFGSRK